jgi:uncharacterized protein (DUF433 family)
MTISTTYPHLTIDIDGQVRIGKTRYKVMHLAAEHYAYGWTAEELLRQHPDLRPEEVYASLTYFYDHFDGMVNEMKETAASVTDSRSSQKFTRDELLRRRDTPGK